MRFRANNHGFIFKEIMKHRTIKEPTTNFPAFLADKDIVDPRKKQAVFPKWSSPSAAVEQTRFRRPLEVEQRAGYRARCVYEYAPQTVLHEGVDQSLVLTNTQPYYELPKSVTDNYDRLHVKDMKQLVTEMIMQSHVWDGTMEKLERRVNKDLPGWRMKAEVGIPQSRITFVIQLRMEEAHSPVFLISMFQKLLRLCETSLVAADFSSLLNRSLTTNNYVSTQFKYDDKVVVIKGETDFLLSSTKPLAPHCADPSSTLSTELPSLFPLSPLINLNQQHFYEDHDVSCWKEGSTSNIPHTLFLSTNNLLSEQEITSRAIMTCFSHTLNHAKRLYGSDVSVLPSPISTQCVASNGVRFQFYCFQLNTADLTPGGAGGVKNQVWIDGGNTGDDSWLFRKIVPARSMLRNTRYQDYDHNIMKKLLAMYANGANL